MSPIQLNFAPSALTVQATLYQTPILDLAGRTDFQGLCLDILMPEDASERFPACGRIEAATVSDCTIEHTDPHMRVRTHADHADIQTVLDLALSVSDDQIDVDISLQLEGNGLIAGAGLALPLAPEPDPLRRKTTVGGETREEIWRLDQNDEDDSEEWQRRVSDKKARWPLWRIGGLLVDAPHHYRIWKANATTTPALTMDEGNTCPGWVEYATSAYSLRVHWQNIHRQPPAGMTIDSEHGLLWLWLHPPAASPRRISGTTTLGARITMVCSG